MPGTNYAWAKAGKAFHQAATPLGLALPIYTGTAIIGGLPIWNPPDSAVDVELLSVELNYASGTAAFASLGIMARRLTAIATGALCTQFDETTPKNGLLFAGSVSKVKSTNAGTVTVTAGAAGDVVKNIGRINLEAETGTGGATGGFTYNFDGSIIIPPGVLAYIVCGKASGALYASTVTWLEIDR